MSHKTEHADRRHGGPGSSHQNAGKPEDEKRPEAPLPGEPTNPDRSRTSGGGGERDVHHTHNPATKS
jgi:hypothetical protein